MKHALTFLFILTAAPLAAQTVAPAGPFPAAEVSISEQHYQRRSLVVFADDADNPLYQRQVQLLNAGLSDLAERDVIIVLDSDPAEPSEWRLRLRPRGFALVLLDKDLTPVFRKPAPWDVREISHTIDRLPGRRQEVLERFPGR